jgi:hypothetical protein
MSMSHLATVSVSKPSAEGKAIFCVVPASWSCAYLGAMRPARRVPNLQQLRRCLVHDMLMYAAAPQLQEMCPLLLSAAQQPTSIQQP